MFASFFFALKVRLKDFKIELCQFKLGYNSQINLQLTGEISLEFDFRLSLLLYSNTTLIRFLLSECYKRQNL